MNRTPPYSEREKDQKLISQLVICGLESGRGIELEKFSARVNSSTVSLPPLERSYVSHILAIHPTSRLKDRALGAEILSLCLPSGLRYCTQKDLPEHAIFHTFANIHADGHRVSGCVLTFYEEVTDETICKMMHDLHTKHFQELSSGNINSANAHPASATSNHGAGGNLGSSQTLPRRGRAHRMKRVAFYDSTSDKLYVTKCLCLIVPIPLVQVSEVLLRVLYDLVCSPNPPEFPLESYVYWFLHEVPLPPPGRSLKLCFLERDLVCQRPSLDELPFFDFILHELLHYVSADQFVKVFTCVLLEHQVLLCSKALHRLMLFAESLVSLLFPFRWQHVYVPILPYSQLMFLEAPLPFIMGLQYQDSIPQDILQSNICMVDIDSGHIQLPEDVPSFPDAADLITELNLVMNKYDTHPSSDARGRKYDWAKRMSRSFDDDALLQQQTTDNLIYRDSLNNTGSPQLDKKHHRANNKALHSVITQSTGGPGNTNSLSRKQLPPLPLNVLNESDSFAKSIAIMRRVGARNIPCIEDIQNELHTSNSFKQSASCQAYFREMRFNNAVREVFLHRFLSIFYSYEHFVIGSFPSREMFEQKRDNMQNFDRASFLSDQPETYLPFMSAFLETQMFTTFIDDKILSQWDEADSNLRLFDDRLKQRNQFFGDAMVRTPTYETCPSFNVTEEMISKREDCLDFLVPEPHSLEGVFPVDFDQWTPTLFPKLNAAVLETVTNASPHRSPWKQRYAYINRKEQLERSEKSFTNSGSNSARYRSSYHPGMEIDPSPAQIAQTNWKFVEQLLRETKAKTKRMLLDKLGREAVELGHTDQNITGVEENTLVASFCDLLERIWSHGFMKKQGKSAFWAHLLSHYEVDGKSVDTGKSINPQFLTPVKDRTTVTSSKPPPAHPVSLYLRNIQNITANSNTADQISNNLLKAVSYVYNRVGTGDFSPTWSPSSDLPPESPTRVQRSSSRPRTPDAFQLLKPMPTHIAFDLKNVLRMSEIKTDIGYARAFVRLALERKLLHKHLSTLLKNQDLLRSMYKRYAFLRCDEERDQFLYHVLSLNAVDYRCFTNTFTKTKVWYQVLVVTGGKFSSNTNSNIYLRLAGSLGQTSLIYMPKGTLAFTFEHKNLGVLSTVRIGHETSINSSMKWYLEHVIIRNEISGHTYKFPCGRWLGKGIDDGSIERLLVAELLKAKDSDDIHSCRTPPRTRSPSARRLYDNNPRLKISEIHQALGEAVNNIVKHFYKPDRQKSHLTQLLCGERGLIRCIEQAFLVGFRSSRLFKQIYPWDYLDKAAQFFSEMLQDEPDRLKPEQLKLISHFVRRVVKIDKNTTLGKDGKFQTFVLLSIRDGVFAGLLPLMAGTPITLSMYEELSFLRHPQHLTFLTRLLHGLNEFDFQLEQSLTWGIDDDRV